jgi:hypothetical protein
MAQPESLWKCLQRWYEVSICLMQSVHRSYVRLDIAANNSAECSNQVVNLTGRGTSHRVSYTHTVNANLVDGAVDRQKVDQVRAERVLGAEPDLLALALDELNDLQCSVLDIYSWSVSTFPL